MTLPADWIIAAYVNPFGAPVGPEAVAHLFAPSTNPKTGKSKLSLLPATAFGPSPEVAEETLIAFLNDEIAREAARKERGRSLAAQRKSA